MANTLHWRRRTAALICILLATACTNEPSDDPVALEPPTAEPEVESPAPAEPETEVLEAVEEADEPEEPATTVPVAETPERLAMVGVPRGLNLRSGPGTNHDVVVGVEKNRILEATGAVSDGWVEVEIDGLTGWMAAQHLEPTDREDPGPAIEMVVVDVAAGLNVRSGPGAEFDILGGAPVGATVRSTGAAEGDWLEVEYDSITGWVLAAYLDPA